MILIVYPPVGKGMLIHALLVQFICCSRRSPKVCIHAVKWRLLLMEGKAPHRHNINTELLNVISQNNNDWYCRGSSLHCDNWQIDLAEHMRLLTDWLILLSYMLDHQDLFAVYYRTSPALAQLLGAKCATAICAAIHALYSYIAVYNHSPTDQCGMYIMEGRG